MEDAKNEDREGGRGSFGGSRSGASGGTFSGGGGGVGSAIQAQGFHKAVEGKGWSPTRCLVAGTDGEWAKGWEVLV